MEPNFCDSTTSTFGFVSSMAHRFCRSILQPLPLNVIVAVTMLFSASGVGGTTSLYGSPTVSPCEVSGRRPAVRQTFVRDPVDCSVFYTCFGNRYWSRTCPVAGTVYSLRYKVCVWRNSVYDDCDSVGSDFHTGSNLIEENTDRSDVEHVEDSRGLSDSRNTWSLRRDRENSLDTNPREWKDSLQHIEQNDLEPKRRGEKRPLNIEQRTPDMTEKDESTNEKKSKHEEPQRTKHTTRTHLKETNYEKSQEITLQTIEDKNFKTEKKPNTERKVHHKNSKNEYRFSTRNEVWTTAAPLLPRRRITTAVPPRWKLVPESQNQRRLETLTAAPPSQWWRQLQLKRQHSKDRQVRPRFPHTTTTTPPNRQRSGFSYTSIQKATLIPPKPHETSHPPWRKIPLNSKHRPQYVTQKPRSKMPQPLPTSPLTRQTRRPPGRFNHNPLVDKNPSKTWRKVDLKTTPKPRRYYTKQPSHFKNTPRTDEPTPKNPFLQSRKRDHYLHSSVVPKPPWWMKKNEAPFVTRQPTPKGLKKHRNQQPLLKTRTTPQFERWWNPSTSFPWQQHHPERTTFKPDRWNPSSPFPWQQQHFKRATLKPKRWNPSTPFPWQQQQHLKRTTLRPNVWNPSTPFPWQQQQHLKRTTLKPNVWNPSTPFPWQQQRLKITTQKPNRWWHMSAFPSPSQRPLLLTTTMRTEKPMTTNLTTTTTTTMADHRDVEYTSLSSPLSSVTTPSTITMTSTPPSLPPSLATSSAKTATTTTATTTTTMVAMMTTRKERLKNSALPHRIQMAEHCGILARPFIIGGRRSRPGQWPWQVSLQVSVAVSEPWHRCGGVLIHPGWVLTAAHCVEGPFYGNVKNWRVVLAEDNLEEESGNEIYRNIIRIISHPGYIRTSNFPNDMALLQLDSEVDLSSGEVRVACLPDLLDSPPDLDNCWISGWGETRGGEGEEKAMNELPVQPIDNDVCSPLWLSVGIHVLDHQVCVGDGHMGACYGDSGGPLMCQQPDGRFYVTGVMSWLINNCSARGFPNVFSRVSSYLDWVYEQLDFHEWFRYN